MRRILIVIVLLAVGIPGGLFLTWDTQTRTLGNQLISDVTAAQKQVFNRTPPPRAPLHDNGYQCLGGMMDVTPSDLRPFSPGAASALEPFITGQKPITELPPEVRARMLAISPWASSLRACGESLHLSWVDGLSPWAPVNQPRLLKLGVAVPSLIEFTALELRVLLADGQPEVALERCTQTWAAVTDQSHLGLAGALNARMAVRRLAPACGEALAKAPAEIRKQVAPQWAGLSSRLASAAEVVEAERLAGSLRVFAYVSDGPIRERLPGVVTAGPTDFMSVMRVGRTWRKWDAAMRKLAAEAAGPGRDAASAAVDALVPSQYAGALRAYDETPVLLGLLADLAAGSDKPLPAGAKKTEQGLEYDNGQQKLIIPLAAAAP